MLIGWPMSRLCSQRTLEQRQSAGRLLRATRASWRRLWLTVVAPHAAPLHRARDGLACLDGPRGQQMWPRILCQPQPGVECMCSSCGACRLLQRQWEAQDLLVVPGLQVAQASSSSRPCTTALGWLCSSKPLLARSLTRYAGVQAQAQYCRSCETCCWQQRGRGRLSRCRTCWRWLCRCRRGACCICQARWAMLAAAGCCVCGQPLQSTCAVSVLGPQAQCVQGFAALGTQQGIAGTHPLQDAAGQYEGQLRGLRQALAAALLEVALPPWRWPAGGLWLPLPCPSPQATAWCGLCRRHGVWLRLSYAQPVHGAQPGRQGLHARPSTSDLLQADEASLHRMRWLGPLQDRLLQAAAARAHPAAAAADAPALRLEVQDKVSPRPAPASPAWLPVTCLHASHTDSAACSSRIMEKTHSALQQPARCMLCRQSRWWRACCGQARGRAQSCPRLQGCRCCSTWQHASRPGCLSEQHTTTTPPSGALGQGTCRLSSSWHGRVGTGLPSRWCCRCHHRWTSWPWPCSSRVSAAALSESVRADTTPCHLLADLRPSPWPRCASALSCTAPLHHQ